MTHALTRSQEIAFFSYDDERKYHADCSSLSYYYPPPIPPEGIDLSKGFEKFHQLDDSNDEHLDSLLRTIMDLEKKDGHMCEADVVTWRGMMTKVRAPMILRSWRWRGDLRLGGSKRQ